MKSNRPRLLVVRLMGGLGNQMFQYAAGRALAARNGMTLALDTYSGFVRDKTYHRRYSLGALPIQAKKIWPVATWPFWLQQAQRKFFSSSPEPVTKYPLGVFVYETRHATLDEVLNLRLESNAWMEGYWQTENYFSEMREELAPEFSLPEPTHRRFLEAAEKIKSCNAVAVGVRIYEEVPAGEKDVSGGVAPLWFYESAANRLRREVPDPVFFVFCTRLAFVEDRLDLPGKIFYITHDNGFREAMERLWLISRCRHHILSNSSFYWWGAWLSETDARDSVIIASDNFANSDSIPERWLRFVWRTR